MTTLPPPDFPEEMLPKEAHLRAPPQRRPLWDYVRLILTGVIAVIIVVPIVIIMTDYLPPLPSFSSLYNKFLIPLGVYAVLMVIQWFENRAIKKLYDTCHSLEDAKELEALAVKSMRFPDPHTYVLMKLARTYVFGGSINQGLTIFAGIYNAKRISDPHSPIHGEYLQLLFDISFCYCLTNELDKALAGFLHEKAPENNIFLDTAIAVRRGRYDAVIQDWERDFAKAERCYTAVVMKYLRLCRAFCLEQKKRSPDEVEKALVGVRPLQEHDSKYLIANWPAMDDFVRAHKLDS